MTNTLKQHLKKLRLSGRLSSLEVRLHEAEANRLPYAEFLELLFQDEINIRYQRLLARRHKSADFHEPRSLDNFDFGFNPSINRSQIYELATCHFVPQHGDVLFIGPPGVGRSHLAQAIGLEALKAVLLSCIVPSLIVYSITPRLSLSLAEATESTRLRNRPNPAIRCPAANSPTP
jgi:DNA replication protein DnaC